MGLLRSLVAWPEWGRPEGAESIRWSSARARLEQRAAVEKPDGTAALSAGCAPQTVVLKSLREACSCRGWTLLAAHVRTNHVHVVTTANCKPEQVMTALKAYGSRALNEH